MAVLAKVNSQWQWCTKLGNSLLIVRINGKVKVLPIKMFEVQE